MRQIRSKKLWQYLTNTGVINGTEEEIIKAKADYRRNYKKVWKLNQLIPKKELRPSFTLKQYQSIKVKAVECGTTPTEFLKQTILSVIESKQVVPEKEVLFEILQQLSMVITNQNSIISNRTLQQLIQVEKLLLEYIKKH